MTDQMRVGRERYLRKSKNQAHNSSQAEKPGPEIKKSGQENYHSAGLFEMLSILRMSL